MSPPSLQGRIHGVSRQGLPPPAHPARLDSRGFARMARSCRRGRQGRSGCGGGRSHCGAGLGRIGCMNNLRVSLIQGETRWHDPPGNRDYYGELVSPLRGITDVVILPETFTSGFSNDAIGDAETMDGPTLAWMREHAAATGAAITGSVQIREGDSVFNRMLWVTPDGA